VVLGILYTVGDGRDAASVPVGMVHKATAERLVTLITLTLVCRSGHGTTLSTRHSQSCIARRQNGSEGADRFQFFVPVVTPRCAVHSRRCGGEVFTRVLLTHRFPCCCRFRCFFVFASIFARWVVPALLLQILVFVIVTSGGFAPPVLHPGLLCFFERPWFRLTRSTCC
jgi:hypothetical protein